MIVKGIVFDVNGTLTDIQTNEWHDDVYRVISNLLSYQGMAIEPANLKDMYFRTIEDQLKLSGQHHPEFDVSGVFRTIIERYATDFTRTLPAAKIEQLPMILAELHRSASRFHLQLYPGVADTIRQLHTRYALAVVSDGQSAYAIAELNAVKLSGYFDPVIVSGDFGYRKPDQRLFATALNAMKLDPLEVVYVGNDMYRDVHGAQKLGMKTVFFKSNQGTQDIDGVKPDYIIYNFPELINAIHFFESP